MVMTVLSLTVTVDGSSKDVAVATSSGNAALDQAAVHCVEGWKWWSIQKDGKATEVRWGTHVDWPKTHRGMVAAEFAKYNIPP
jgi:TonB family protein